MKVRLIEITENAEKTMVYIARVSSPENQENENYASLLRYCLNHRHWSVFEHADLTLEIETSTAIATQMIRHRSFAFQQFSQRYSDPTQLGFEPIEWRKQAEKNRQSSSGLIDPTLAQDYNDAWNTILNDIEDLYNNMLAFGVAKECARFILPQCTSTRLYMTGNIRSWIHYLEMRTGEDVQLEHRQVALAAKKIFISHLPIISAALGWTESKEKANESKI